MVDDIDLDASIRDPGFAQLHARAVQRSRPIAGAVPGIGE